MRRAGLLLAALALLAACGTADAGAPTDTPLLGEWELTGGSLAGAPLAMPTTATLVATEDRVRGQAFCNSYEGGYTADGDSFAVGDLAVTEAACVDSGVMAAEQDYVAALLSVRRADITDGSLLLSGADVQLRFVRPTVVPDRELTGTRWVLDTLVDGETASSVQGEALLHLAADGTASGSTGCSEWTGGWRLDGDALVVEPGPPTPTGCDPGLAAQVEHVLAVLASAPTVTVDGDRLTLTATDGRGLGYRAG